MKEKWKSLIISIALPLLVGALSGLLTKGGMEDFALLKQPPLSPPDWLFPIVWTLLYTLMGIASWLILRSSANRETVRQALWLYGMQLLFNFIWPILFFNLALHYFAFFWLLALWVMILFMLRLFFLIDKRTLPLLLPYALWVGFALYLNLGVALLN